MNINGWIKSSLLIVLVAVTAIALATWKYTSIQESNAVAASQPEPMESVTVAVAKERMHRKSTTSIGTVTALRSITLKNEDPGTVHNVLFTSGQVVQKERC